MRISHISLRIKDLEKTLDFYTHVLGMKLFKKKDFPEGRFSLAFVRYGEEDEATFIEFVYNWDNDKFVLNNTFGNLVLSVDDIYKSCEYIKSKGGKILSEPQTLKVDKEVQYAFIEDPSGYKIELVQL